MTEEIFTTTSPRAIEGLIEEWSSFTPASRTLDGLSSELAVTKLDWWPYSIAELVAHMLFWQRNDLETIKTGVEPKVLNKADEWPLVTQNDWPRLKDEFLKCLEQIREIARNENLDRLILGGKFSVGLRIVWFTGHNAHHLGQVIFMRRVLGAWPPPGGGM